MQLTRGKVRVDWDDLGESDFGGDYNPDNPRDLAILRFTVYKEDDYDGWLPVDDASYATAVPVDTPEPELQRLLKIIMDVVYKRVMVGLSIKKDCEALSWLAQHDSRDGLDDWFRKRYGRKLGAVDPIELER